MPLLLSNMRAGGYSGTVTGSLVDNAEDPRPGYTLDADPLHGSPHPSLFVRVRWLSKQVRLPSSA